MNTLPPLLFISSIIPLYYSSGGAPIYYLSVTWIIAAAFTLSTKILLETKIKLTLESNIDRLVALYIFWIFLSFFIGTTLNVLEENLATFSARIISLTWTLLILSSYFVGRQTNIPDKQLRAFLSIFNIFFVTAGISLVFFFILSGDLYLARRITEQRMPLIIVFWAWTFGAIGICEKRYSYLFPWALGTIVVLLSLTRAAYVAWFAVIFFLIPILPTKKIATLFLTVTGVLTFTLLITLSQDNAVAEQLISRFEDYLFSKDVVETDYSANVRVEVWKGLLETLLQHPTAFIFGFGQLGPSYFEINIVDPLGNVIPSTSAHSQYLDSIFRTGIVGLYLELLIFYQIVWKAARNPRISIALRSFSAALGAALVYGVFHETLRWPVFGILFWFLSGCISRKIAETKNEQANSFTPRVTTTYNN